ncbi:membrane protein [Flavobacterium gelidilacus]|uniref:membrane protein n=1 Tax=Flavobacterium gelidilacus TaxID=206041 RepID=UPI000428F9A0|nr:membrane protein [Flavobacterium gelidilacus]
MKETSNKYLIVALLFGITFHGSAIFFTIENTYDALIHMFFGNHYANSWFEPWNYSWYTGFTVMGYPPLVHQAIGLLSYIGGLKFGMFAVAIIGIVLFVTGSFRYAVLITGNRTVAGYAAIVAILSSSFVETLHIFGQLPSIIGVSLLMHAMPEIYLYVKTGKRKYYFTSLSLIAVTVCSHHVTPLFGMVFFISPLIGMVIMDASREQVSSYKEITFKVFFNTFLSLFKRIVLFCSSAVFLIVFCILPYWINSKANPITQVPIPHGSRDNFLEVTSSGLMFFLIPWGILLFILPYIFYRYYSKRYIFFGLSITLLTILGTGGTTPIPLKMLGETAFNILTLDRFTLWASIMSLPIFGEFVYRLVEGDLKTALQNKFGTIYHRILGGLFAGSFLLFTIFTITLGYFRPLQPDKINFLPIVNFLNQDQHDQWRFLPLGFGDQMAFLSTQTKAMTVDGNYHSARRLPELTTRAVERLENSKFRGVEGIGSLQQFLTVPEKYNLKYVFSNDKFYDPILYFCGWHRLTQLENGIMVWEKLNVQPLSKILPKDEVSIVLKLMWGIIPMLTVLIAFILNIQMIWLQALKIKVLDKPAFLNHGIVYNGFKSGMIKVLHIWTAIVLILFGIGIYFTYIKNATQISPENVVKSYYDALDYKFYEKAYSYIVPDKEYGVSQFMLEISVSDGILNSYGKLDAIETTIKHNSTNKASVIAKTKWITPLEIIEKTYTHEVEKIKGKWYIVPEKKDTDLPPDEFIATNVNSYYKQGRRKISTQQTYHDDILRQPDLEIIKANLVYFDNKYMIIGEVQNIDNVPADVVLKASLYDEKDKMLGTFNAKYVIKHKLMPKETTSFKVNFEDIAWLNATDVKPTSFNPDEFTDKNFNNKPVTFDIQSAGNVAISDLYTAVAISDLVVSDKEIKGTLFNYGIQEVTVPEVLISYYNDKKELIYVDHKFIKEGVRIQRKQYFTYSFLNLSSLKSLKYSTENCFVNGISNEAIARGVIKKRKTNEEEEQLQKVNGKGFAYIKIELNNYIGNPK